MTEVRQAGPDDLDRIVELEELCVGDDAWSRNLLEQGLLGEVPTVTYFVATDGAEVIGYAVASYIDDVVELQRIGVDPAARRGGVATALIDVMSTQIPASRTLLEVRENNDGALALYGRLGFVEIARRQRYYRDGATALVLCREAHA